MIDWLRHGSAAVLVGALVSGAGCGRDEVVGVPASTGAVPTTTSSVPSTATPSSALDSTTPAPTTTTTATGVTAAEGTEVSWRLLADELVGPTYTTTVALDDSQYVDLWRSVGLSSGRPPVDFATSIVIHFGATYGSGGCEDIRFEDVVIDEGEQLVYAEISGPGGPCNDDANPRAFVVAVAREVLPADPFRVQLESDLRCVGCDGSERTVVYLAAGTTDDNLQVLAYPATRPRDDPLPPGLPIDEQTLQQILRIFEAYGNVLDPASEAVTAARDVDRDAFVESIDATRTALAGTEGVFAELAARFTTDSRPAIVAVGGTLDRLLASEAEWVAVLAEMETSIQLRTDQPGSPEAFDAWKAAAQRANEARALADTQANDLIYAVEIATFGP